MKNKIKIHHVTSPKFTVNGEEYYVQSRMLKDFSEIDSLIEKELNNHPGLYLGGNALKGVAINDCVENAESMAVRVARWWNKEGKDRNEK